MLRLTEKSSLDQLNWISKSQAPGNLVLLLAVLSKEFKEYDLSFCEQKTISSLGNDLQKAQIEQIANAIYDQM